ncbi:unnamed protein product, partial [Rotaria sordida]
MALFLKPVVTELTRLEDDEDFFIPSCSSSSR